LISNLLTDCVATCLIHLSDVVMYSYRADGQGEHVLWPEMSHLLHSSAKWTTKNKKRKSGAEGEQLLMQLELQCCTAVDHSRVTRQLYAPLAVV
jgi:hypothetical protein